MIWARWFWCTIFTSILFFSVENSYALNFLKIDAVEIEKETESVEDSVLRPKRIMSTQWIDEAPVIDGSLTDGCWALGEWQSNYTQFSPKYGGEASRKTEIKIFYDDKNVYAGIRAYDDMSKMSRKLDRRDNFTGDLVGIHIDSYFDHRTAFEFDLTSAGQKIDVWVGNDGWDMNWNAVWYGKVAYEDSAWTAEFKIPLSQLRYSQQENQVWGLNSWRKIDRLQEEHHWNLVANDGTGLVYTFGELHGLKGLKKNKRFELAPYVSSKLTAVEKTAGNPFSQKPDFAGQGGIDALIGISNNTTLSATINPDFGQVEADPSVMNLTAFETYFEEKRPFFVEGKNIFDFTFDDDLLFYTRRIGHAPSYNPGFENMQMPENTTIAGALKLSGKTSKGLSFGIIESLTTKEFADIYDAGEEFSQVVEPLSNYFIGRFQQEYDHGNTLIGGMLTQTHRTIKDEHLNFLSSNALTYGADFTRYWKDREYFFETKLIGSSINGDEEAISRLQTSSARYYQRPDSDNAYDPNLTKLNGIGASVKAGKWSKGHWRYNEEINYRSPGLELNDLGFMMLADLLKNNTSVSYVEKENKSIFKNYEFNLQQQNAWNSAGDGLYSQAVLSSHTEFMNSWMLVVNGSYKWRINDEQLLRGGPSMKLPDQLALHYMAYTNQAKNLIVSLSGTRAIHLTGNSNLTSVSPEISLRVRSNLRFSFQTDFQKTLDELQYIQHVNKPDNSTSYLLGTIDNRNLGFTLRVDLAVTPEMTIQYYASPFVSIGKYKDFKRVTDPQSSAYDQRFTTMVPDIQNNMYYFDENLDGTADYSISNPDFNFQQFRSNLVFRWEYRAGSTIYLVWSQDRTNYDPAGSFSFHDGFKKMADLHPKNILMIKLSYWFSA
ncbi:DUF5916 domain-containing protein [Draconibacterium mangrovi]|uniref:DUF5916 domain-containing protein n=1 Tax=Draconibacterium mangrovi TaxID=2697469 RepID=UPI0013D1B58A|nr:DUF5916 domain-containing protein [Draconibacterium mangrovi]